MKTRIQSTDRMSNAGLHRSGGLSSPASRWSLKNIKTGEYVKIGNHRGDETLDIEIDLEPGRYVLTAGRGRDSITQWVNVGEEAQAEVAAKLARKEAMTAQAATMATLRGTDKQVAWAERIRRGLIERYEDDPEEMEALSQITDASLIIDADQSDIYGADRPTKILDREQYYAKQ